MEKDDIVDINAIADFLEARGQYQWVDVHYNNQPWRVSKSQGNYFSFRNMIDSESGGSWVGTRAQLFSDHLGKSFKVLRVSEVDTRRQAVIQSKDTRVVRKRKRK
jgi:hypothetical protein